MDSDNSQGPEKILAQKKKAIETIIEMGKFYFLNQKFDEAMAEYKKAIALDSKSIDAYYNLGITLEALSDEDGARDAFAKVIELEPGNKGAQEHYDRLVEK
ncbi:MAG: tetratricopeptide repeat protein [Candidatus Edwardsbacteria bacterium]|nr:tetratricopeptide repeat protein [Candidatus Edwardsbacteria bacterium]MBU1576975.1 tetratricopeptide repeat protein [Candidatus Edwardsbacteria bacterium]MBU2462925.1 tetratricopeptide repeat protein [Candidatus Edwardsbacteria bacterium]MBU2594634.1 tetratricopeptide repeat protein [Candidatus Edwardsbacteria bacterium]